MITEQEGADTTAQVFGEAFMKLVRERLKLDLTVSSNNGSVSVTAMLSDECPVRGKRVFAVDSVTVGVVAAAAPLPQLIVRKGC